jgi:hypothetical protein
MVGGDGIEPPTSSMSSKCCYLPPLKHPLEPVYSRFVSISLLLGASMRK